MLRPDPIYWIDSLQDLYEWKELKIQTFTATYLYSLTEHNTDDPMANNFKDRLEVLTRFPKENGVKSSLNDLDYKGIVEGRTAFVGFLQMLTTIKYKLKDLEEDIDYHISTTEEMSQAIQMWTNRVRLNQSMFDKLNMVYDKCYASFL